MMNRYWINQPSTLQPDHNMHGQNVLAERDLGSAGKTTTVYPVTGEIISTMVFVTSLSPGWNSQRRQQAAQ